VRKERFDRDQGSDLDLDHLKTQAAHTQRKPRRLNRKEKTSLEILAELVVLKSYFSGIVMWQKYVAENFNISLFS
jgi:hypothetical protein